MPLRCVFDQSTITRLLVSKLYGFFWIFSRLSISIRSELISRFSAEPAKFHAIALHETAQRDENSAQGNKRIWYNDAIFP